MECHPRVVRERTVVPRISGEKPQTIIQFYCPVFGELILSGDKAREVRQRLKEMQGKRADAAL